jgi:hypothetical protein
LFFIFYENILGKLLGFDRMHENKKKFTKEINLIFFKILFLKPFRRKLDILIPDLYLTV